MRLLVDAAAPPPSSSRAMRHCSYSASFASFAFKVGSQLLAIKMGGFGEDTGLLFDRPLASGGGLRCMEAMMGRLRASCSQRDRFCCRTPISRSKLRMHSLRASR